MNKLSYSAITLLTAIVLLRIPYPTAEAATYTVTTTTDNGPGSLRLAIDDANTNPGFDTINFAIAGPGPHRIAPASPLPTISDAVLIDGYSQTKERGVRPDPTLALPVQDGPIISYIRLNPAPKNEGSPSSPISEGYIDSFI